MRIVVNNIAASVGGAMTVLRDFMHVFVSMEKNMNGYFC